MKRLRTVYLLQIFILLLAFRGHGQLYSFRNYSHKDGLNIASAESIDQTPEGMIWLGTDGAGIIGYDGFRFNELPKVAGQRDHHVTSIHFKGKKIYFTSKYVGIFETDGISAPRLRAKTVTQDGELLYYAHVGTSEIAATTTGIFRIENGKFVRLTGFTGSTAKTVINSVILRKDYAIILTNKGNYHYSSTLKRLIPLNNWLHLKKNVADFIRFAFCDKGKIYFTDAKGTKWLHVVLGEKDRIFSTRFLNRTMQLDTDEYIVDIRHNDFSRIAGILTNKCRIFKFEKGSLHRVMMNTNSTPVSCNRILVDRYGDFWLASTLKGLYKISLEPFTRIELHPVYQSADIMTMFRSSAGDILLSTGEGKTFFGVISSLSNGFQTFPFRTTSFSDRSDHVLLGTSSGIKKFSKKTKKIENLELTGTVNEQINLIFSTNELLIVGVAGKGLKAFTYPEGKPINILFKGEAASHLYTAQESYDKRGIYCGTNNGVYFLDKRSMTFHKIEFPENDDAYIGNSVIDAFGTIWLSGEKALLGIRKNGEMIVLDEPSLFPSTLFYTLNSDEFGDLIIGTNKGISVLKLNQYGKVLSTRTYSGDSGFTGYETHMRSQFQDGNTIFVGTIEGLFQINMDLLQNLAVPVSPVIRRTAGRNTAESPFAAFQFSVCNPKINNIEYSYRISGQKGAWSAPSFKNDLVLDDLPNGRYTILVRASFDGEHWSQPTAFSFEISSPFYKSKWFVLLLITLVVGINVWFINKNKSFGKGLLMSTKDYSVTLSLTPAIILFALVADFSLHMLSPIIAPEVGNNLGMNLIVVFLELLLFFSAQSDKQNAKRDNYKFYLIAAFLITLVHNLIDLYVSNLHPFFILAVILINAISPFILDRLKMVLIYNTLLILIACSYVFLLENTVYNQHLFLLAILISSVLSVFATYLRYDAMERMMFISGVINKGNVPAIAFGKDGFITYVSENISQIVGMDHEQLLGKHISYLNRFLPEQGGYRRIDLTTEFADGKIYLTPMISPEGSLIWMEWSCKEFAENLKVILGQNVTEKLEVERTYELLVQNAEDLIYQCDVNGNFVFLNQRCFDRLGYRQDDMLGKNSLDFVPEIYRERVQHFYEQHFNERRNSSYHEFPILTSQGEEVWVGQYVTTLFKTGNTDHISGFLALARDITSSREQQEIIRQQKDDITSSISYAQKIQFNLLPQGEKISSGFKENCVIYRPKDIVSGDFFWMEEVDGKFVAAIADCTGHGVPGAFMTILGINLLNTIILEQHTLNPSTILSELDKKLIYALPRENGEENLTDGMEITVCVFDPEKQEIAYACAGSRFLIYDNGSFTMFKGDNKHIGDSVHDFRGYVTHYTRFGENAIIFLYTDGFQDQFGGNKDKKYSFRRMIELFESNIRLPLPAQKEMIEEEFNRWKGEFPQTDDVSILIFKGLKKKYD